MDQLITYQELEKHRTEDSCWIIIDGKVHDVTDFLNEHPGGKEILLQNAGLDASLDFFTIHKHSQNAIQYKNSKAIGLIESASKDQPHKKEQEPMVYNQPAKNQQIVINNQPPKNHQDSSLLINKQEKNESSNIEPQPPKPQFIGQCSLKQAQNKFKSNQVWVVIDDNIYNLTTMTNQHPGGAKILQQLSGKDASRQFKQMGHSVNAVEWRQSFKVGGIKKEKNWKFWISGGAALSGLVLAAFVLKKKWEK